MTKFVKYDGKKYKIIGKTGKYFLCEKGKQFRILNPYIQVIIVDDEEKPKKKKPAKKEQVEQEEIVECR